MQYAAPWEKNTEMSDPISPDHFSSCALLAGFPPSSLAAHSAAAALPLPPPRPAPEAHRCAVTTLLGAHCCCFSCFLPVHLQVL